MRLENEKITLLKRLITKHLPSSDIYLFGSRADETKKGGDIDILILGDRELKREEKSSIEFSFFQKFGEQKLDLVSFKTDCDKPFKDIALEDAVIL